MKPKSSLFRIIWTDYLTSLSVIVPVVLWGLILVGYFFDPEAASFFLIAAPVATAVGLVVIVWRVWLIRSVLDNGTEVPGIISGIGFFRGRGRITYVYTYQDTKYQTTNRVQSTAVARALAHGQDVTVMIDPLKPKRAFVRELYVWTDHQPGRRAV